MLTIDFIAKGMQYSIPNSWDGLTPYHFQALMRDIQRFAEGKISVGMVRANYVCRIMGWNLQKIRNTDGWANVAWLAEQVTFPFTIVYPDNDAALQELDSETYRLCKKIPTTPVAWNNHIQVSGQTGLQICSRLMFLQTTGSGDTS